MKLSSIIILIVPTFLTTVTASSATSSSKSNYYPSKLYLSELELDELSTKNGGELEAWINEKRLEYDIINEDSSLTSSESASSNNSTPITSPKSSFALSPKASFTTLTFSNFDQIMLASLSNVISLKTTKSNHISAKLINCIPNLKMTFRRSNFSVLSLIASLAKKRFLGQLIRSEALEYFRPLISGNGRKFAGAYFLGLSLFHPTIQIQVMTLLIENAPNLRGILLINSIYYNLHEDVFNLLISAGATINFSENDHAVSPLRFLPNYDKYSEEQVPISKRLFMNYYERTVQADSWVRNTSLDSELNFIYGMLEVGLPDEMGVLRVAFENYSPRAVMKLVEISPMPLFTNYHLAHLLAKSPEKSVGYPAIESLVDFKLVFDRLIAGETDIVGLACLSAITPFDQVQVITEFLSKTTIFRFPKINNDQIIIYPTSLEVMEQSGIPEFPLSPANVFFLTSCKFNIADEAFALIWNVCKNVNSKQFILAKKYASEWADSKVLIGKVEIMSQK